MRTRTNRNNRILHKFGLLLSSDRLLLLRGVRSKETGIIGSAAKLLSNTPSHRNTRIGYRVIISSTSINSLASWPASDHIHVGSSSPSSISWLLAHHATARHLFPLCPLQTVHGTSTAAMSIDSRRSANGNMACMSRSWLGKRTGG